MKAQRLSWYCGIAAVANALECLDIHMDQEEIATLCHVTKKHGTSEEEIMRAVLACGAKVIPWSSRRRRASMYWLQSTLLNNGPVILCVDHWSHWVTVIGTLTQTTFIVFDPASDKGLMLYDYEDLAARWRLGNHRGGPKYDGIGVSK